MMKKCIKKASTISFFVLFYSMIFVSPLWSGLNFDKVSEIVVVNDALLLQEISYLNDIDKNTGINERDFYPTFDSVVKLVEKIEKKVPGRTWQWGEGFVFSGSHIDRYLQKLIEKASANENVLYRFDNWFLNFCFATNASMYKGMFDKLNNMVKSLDTVIKTYETGLSENNNLKQELIEKVKGDDSSEWKSEEALKNFKKAFVEKVKEVKKVYAPLLQRAQENFFLRNPCTTVALLFSLLLVSALNRSYCWKPVTNVPLVTIPAGRGLAFPHVNFLANKNSFFNASKPILSN